MKDLQPEDLKLNNVNDVIESGATTPDSPNKGITPSSSQGHEGDDDRWRQASASWRDRWERNHGEGGRHWDEVESYYRFGHELLSDPRFLGKSFSEVESSVRAEWENHGGGRQWDEVNPHLREMWEGGILPDGTSTKDSGNNAPQTNNPGKDPDVRTK